MNPDPEIDITPMAVRTALDITSSFMRSMREHGVRHMKYTNKGADGADETWEITLGDGAFQNQARQLKPDQNFPQMNIPRDEEALLAMSGGDSAIDDRTPEQRRKDEERRNEEELYAAVGVVPELG